ncbi:hypothetical protein ACFLTT_03420 [Chloroflexota bacterium]
MIIVIIAVIFLLVMAMGAIMSYIARRSKREGKTARVNYRGLCIFGIIVAPLSIISMVVFFIYQIPFYVNLPLFALGVIYLIIGWRNRDTWRKT